MDANMICDFWFKELTPDKWFNGGEEIDALIRRRFEQIHAAAAKGELAEWRQTIKGRLAEIIVLDQFSRNLFRGSGNAFVNDGMALVLAQEALKSPAISMLKGAEKAFLLMPFMHSESYRIHEEALNLFGEPGLESYLEYERRHQEIIARFGRYPHRNKALGRETTLEEAAFLTEPNTSF